ncbi:MAG: MaoC family dehydratase [Solirubrobacteraceae bacterium]
MSVELTIAELLSGSGRELGATRWVPVPENRIASYAAATGDRAGPAAQPLMTLSLVPSLLPELLRITDSSFRLNYGAERVRFHAPVPGGSHVRVRARVADARPRGSGVLYALAVEVELRGSEQPALTAELLSLAYPVDRAGVAA